MINSRAIKNRGQRPLILIDDLSFLLGSEVVLYVEELSDFLNRLVLDQSCNLGAGELKQWRNVKKVGSHYKFKKNIVLQVNVLGAPWVDDG